MKKKVTVIIPARFASTRFPGKVIAELQGKPIIQWVYEKAKAASNVDNVFIAVDNAKVADIVKGFGGTPIMTPPDLPSGTDRIWEVAKNIDTDIVINVQGDEPLIPTEVIEQLADKMSANANIEMGTVAVNCSRKDIENNPNVVKVIFNANNNAIYFSRAMIPFLRTGGEDMIVYRHWGIYAYRKDILKRIISLPESLLEKCEKLEQLRALENGIKIFVLTSNLESIGIDTPEDLLEAEKKLRSQKKYFETRTKSSFSNVPYILF